MAPSKPKTTGGIVITGTAILLIAIFAFGISVRLLRLGHWAYHHDESIHAWYAYRLYTFGLHDDANRNVYEYNPVYHGPFLYHIGAFFFFLFGDSDFTGRLPFAAFGILMMVLAYQLHHLIGKPRAILAVLFIAISPGLTYFSRFARNDVYFATETLAVLLFALLYFRDRRWIWFYALAFWYALLYATKENSYVTGFVFCGFIVMYVVLRTLWDGFFEQDWKRTLRSAFTDYFEFTALTGLYGIFSLCTFLYIKFPIDAQKDSILQAAGAGDISRDIAQSQFRGYIMQHEWLPTTMIVLGVLGGILFLIAIHVVRALLEGRNGEEKEGSPRVNGETSAGLLDRCLFSDIRLVIALAIIAVVYVFLFTTMFSNAQGLTDGITDYVRYWYAQKFKPRIAQAELGSYYYLYFFIIYDLAAFLLATWGIVYYGIRLVMRLIRHIVDTRLARPVSEREQPSLAAPTFLSLWTLVLLVFYVMLGKRIPWPAMVPYAFVTLPLAIIGGYFVLRCVDTWFDRLFLGIWTLGVLVFYGVLHVWIPWKVALRHILPTLPAAIVVGHFVFRFVDSRLARAAPEEKEPSLAIPIFISFWTLTSLFLYSRLHERVPWLYTHQALPAAILAGYFLGEMYLRFRRRRWVWIPGAVLVGMVGLFSLRANILLNLYRWDDAREVMVYVQSSRTVREIVHEVERVAYEAGTFEDTTIGVSGWAQWPFSWYLRHYKAIPGARDKRYLINIAEPKDHIQLQLVFGDEFESMKYSFRDHWTPRLEARFMGNKFSKQWWRNHLRYFIYRIPWSDVGGAELVFYRKRQLREVAPMVECPPGSERPPRPGSFVKSWGRLGAANGEFHSPRGLAVSPDGHLYVCDSQNFRIQKFTLEGQFVLAFGGQTGMMDSGKFVGRDSGAFGIACDSQGFVYVADTWGNRIQKFDSNGNFITQWRSGTAGDFFGPRDLTVDAQDRVYVADTGNKRILVYDSTGKFLNQQIGRDGSAPGEFVEPVGIEISTQQELHVADVGNKRVQALSTAGRFLKQWNVCGWESEIVAAVEAYLAVAADGTVYVTDSTRNCVYQFIPGGQSVMVWGTLGSGTGQLRRPTGIAVDQNGFIYVADTGNHRINKYRKLQ